MSEQGVPKRLLTGRVISDKMEKTCVVTVERVYKDPRYKKVMRAVKKYSVHDDADMARVGDIVEIYEGRPASKTKYMYLNRVVESAKARGAGGALAEETREVLLSPKVEKNANRDVAVGHGDAVGTEGGSA